jgi:hypothetical protein
MSNDINKNLSLNNIKCHGSKKVDLTQYYQNYNQIETEPDEVREAAQAKNLKNIMRKRIEAEL